MLRYYRFMPKRSDFIDYQLYGVPLRWVPNWSGWNVSVDNRRARVRTTSESGWSVLLGWYWLAPVALLRLVHALWRRFCIRGAITVDSRCLLRRKSKLFRAASYEWRADDVLLLEPVEVQLTNMFGGTASCSAYRLTVLPKAALGDEKASVDALWRSYLEKRPEAGPALLSMSGDMRDGERWLQTFLHLEIALSTGEKISESSTLPFIDCTRAPVALVETVEATPYSLESVGSVSMVSSMEEGAISVMELSGAGEVPAAQQVDKSENCDQPARVRLRRIDKRTDIQMSYLSTLRMISASTQIVGLLTVLGLLIWLMTVVFELWRDEHVEMAALVMLGVIFLLSIGWSLITNLRDRVFRVVWLRLDQDVVEVLKCLEHAEKRILKWTDVYAIRAINGESTSKVQIRTETSLANIVVPTDSADWLASEMNRWCARAAWKHQRDEMPTG